jgi:hypothetical protein
MNLPLQMVRNKDEENKEEFNNEEIKSDNNDI